MPETKADLKFQTFWPRFWAGWVDGMVLLPLFWVDAAIWGTVTTPVLLILWYLVYSFSGLIYSILLHGLYGQTIGKKLMGVKVLDVSESKLSMQQAVLRDGVMIAWMLWGVLLDVPVVATGTNPAEAEKLSNAQWAALYAGLGWFALELLTMLSNSKRRAIHDFIARSVVVRVTAIRGAPNERAVGV